MSYLDFCIERMRNTASHVKHNSRHCAMLKPVNNNEKTLYGFNYIYTHAETAVLKKSRKTVIYDLYVCRLDSMNNFVYSKPCYVCIVHIKKGNIRNIFYTTQEGKFAKESSLDIQTDHKKKTYNIYRK